MKPIKKIKQIWWTLVRWIFPQFAEIKIELSDPLPDGHYVIRHRHNTDDPYPIKIKNGKIYRAE